MYYINFNFLSCRTEEIKIHRDLDVDKAFKITIKEFVLEKMNAEYLQRYCYTFVSVVDFPLHFSKF